MSDEKNVIITGSNRGIGFAILKECAENNFNIWACARTKNETWEQKLLDLSHQNNIWIKPIYFDMRNREKMKKAFSLVFKEKKNIDAVINNAGITIYNQSFMMTSMEQIRDLYDVNLFALMEFTQLCLKKMIRQKKGSIVNIASICGEDILPSNTIYGSSKAAVISFTKNLASEVGRYGIRVNAVAPGPTDTDIISPVKEYFEKTYVERVALNRIAKKEDIAKAVMFLISDHSSFISGQTLRVDGGAR